MYSLLVHIAAFSTMVIYYALISIPYIIIQFFPEKQRAHCMRALVLGMGKCVIYIAMRPFVKIKYTDAAGGIDVPAIYVCNHRSGSDAFLMAAFDKEAIQIVNGWPMKLPVFGFNARRCGYIDATKAGMEDFAGSFHRCMEEGVSILVFPEGHRSQSRAMGTFHSGVFHMAMELGIPIYPCCITGNENFPDRHFRFHPTRCIHIKRLPPLMPEDFANMPSAFVLKRKVHQIITAETALMDAELDAQNQENSHHA